eukprot:6079190-Prymnesium_polylepis.1
MTHDPITRSRVCCTVLVRATSSSVPVPAPLASLGAQCPSVHSLLIPTLICSQAPHLLSPPALQSQLQFYTVGQT